MQELLHWTHNTQPSFESTISSAPTLTKELSNTKGQEQQTGSDTGTRSCTKNCSWSNRGRRTKECNTTANSACCTALLSNCYERACECPSNEEKFCLWFDRNDSYLVCECLLKIGNDHPPHMNAILGGRYWTAFLLPQSKPMFNLAFIQSVSKHSLLVGHEQSIQFEAIDSFASITQLKPFSRATK